MTHHQAKINRSVARRLLAVYCVCGATALASSPLWCDQSPTFVSAPQGAGVMMIQRSMNPSVALDAGTGTYTIKTARPDWTFSGTVGVPMTDVKHATGKDRIGPYVEDSFEWTTDHMYSGSIRSYDVSMGQCAFRFAITCNEAQTGPPPPFPSFGQFPKRLNTMSYRDDNFSPHRFALEQTSTPWVLFDVNGNTAVLSPASDFMVSKMTGSLDTNLSSGLQPQVAALPAGFTHETLLCLSSGIEDTIHFWGDTLTSLTGKPRPNDDADPMLKYLGYWTDNGAYYYYNYDADKGYAGTLLAVRDEFKKDNIPLHYMQLDSWWYQKTKTFWDGTSTGGSKNSKLPPGTWNGYGGTLDYSASPDLFPNGLGAFQQLLGMPLVVHGRWIDPASPYHATYNISGIAPVDPAYWDDRTKYLRDNGVFCYEQDWLIAIYRGSPQMSSDLATSNAFTDNMARAAKANNQTLQYCMPTARYFLQGSKYDNLTTIRTSDDHFVRQRWNNFVYTSIYADALRIRPWADVTMSTDTGNMLIEDLSTGPVGIGDEIGTESTQNIMKCIRADGVIIKPDVALLPTDSSIESDFADEHRPLIASSYTDNGQKTVYILAFTRPGDSSTVDFSPASLGLEQTKKVYVTSLNGPAQCIDSGSDYSDTLGASGWNYYVLAPVGSSGIAFFGDADKFVGNGRQRIASMQDQPGRLTVTVETATGEPVDLTGYAPAAPTVTVAGGTAGPVAYNAATQQFTVTINAASQHLTGSVWLLPSTAVVTFHTAATPFKP